MVEKGRSSHSVTPAVRVPAVSCREVVTMTGTSRLEDTLAPQGPAGLHAHPCRGRSSSRTTREAASDRQDRSTRIGIGGDDGADAVGPDRFRQLGALGGIAEPEDDGMADEGGAEGRDGREAVGPSGRGRRPRP